MTTPPSTVQFSQSFRNDLHLLMEWRRDVRHFRTDPVDDAALTRCLNSFALAPSVGLTEPSRIVRVESTEARAKVIANFEAFNAEALSGAKGEKYKAYAALKLQSLRDAPVQFAVFCDDTAADDKAIDIQAMPELLRYSVSSAIMQFWLALRAEGIGLGWVSLLDAATLKQDLSLGADLTLVGYLCVGYPKEQSAQPDLEQLGFEKRRACPEIIAR